VAPELRARVLRAVAALNYQPLQAARALALERHETIGVLVDEELLGYYYGASLLSGASLAATERGWRTLMCAVRADATQQDCERLPVFRTRSVDGVILDVTPAGELLESMLARAGIACISINPSDNHAVNAIVLDDVDVARQATEFLIARGHTRIGYVPFHAQAHSSHLKRMQGYLSALTAAGLQPLPYWDEPLPLPAQQPAEVRRRLECWRTRHACTALLVYNGTLAPRVFCACYELGWRIPDHVSVMCCDTSPALGLLPLAMTHMALERINMGRRAVTMLEERLNSHADVPSLLLRGELREGTTVAPRATSSYHQ
jgi:DNA-binding LacI/PurR family transcriptional regulator